MEKLKEQPQQTQAIRAIGCNVAVSAGAGSGKTRVLVERFVHILQQGQGATWASDILAITFTRKAAAEMKERVRKLLAERADGDASGFWREQLEDLERAQISTIHGLCSRILRENPVEAQLDPGFTLAEEFEGEEFMARCLQKYLRMSLRRQDQAVCALVELYGVNALRGQLTELLPELENIVSWGDLAAPYQNSFALYDAKREELCAVLQDLELRIAELAGKATAALAALAEQLPEAMQAVSRDDYVPLDNAMQGVTARGKLKDSVKAVRNLRAELDALAADKAAAALLPLWQEVLQDLAAYIRGQKQERDLLTFDDLELLTLRLLENNPQVRRKYQERFHYIMVDEFQDTNERQKRLIYFLCGDSGEQLQGDKLFIVGDPKQSIYRFRGADVSVFAKVRRDIAAQGGQLLTLSKNFRSADKILTTVNVVFKTLLGEDTGRDVYFEALDFDKSGTTRPELLLLPYDKECGRSSFEVEAEALAHKVRSVHDEGVPYGEMAVLLRSVTHCGELAEALQRCGVPYEIIDGKDFYERQEVLDLLHLLTALQNRRRSLELAGVLRSPYFGLDDETLTKLFLSDAECLWDALQQADADEFPQEQGALLRRAASILAELRSCAALCALPELWQRLWQTLAVDGVLSLQEHGANKLANAKKLRQLAQEYCAQQNGTLGGWLDYVRRLREAAARETTANLNSVDAVRIMTIHKSKGLEFNTVFLPFLGNAVRSDASIIKFLPDVGLGITAPLANGQLIMSGVLQRVKALDKELELEERKRQLYVAMTRAEGRLIMCGVTSGKEKNDKPLAEQNWLQQLKRLLEDGTEAAVQVFASEAQYAGAAAVCEPETVTEELLAAIAPLPVYAESGRRQFSPSALQTYLQCPRMYYYQQVLRLPGLEETGDGARLPAYVTGLIVHRALEIYNGDEQEALAAGVKQYAPGCAAPEAAAMLRNYLSSELYRSLPAKQRRELSFVYPAGAGLSVVGVIDLVGETEAGLLLVDYKTGRPPAPGQIPLGYAYQLALYRAAAEKILRRSVAQARLHYLQDLSARDLPNDRDYLADALSLCREISAKGREEDFTCRLESCGHCQYNYLCKQK
ncbi:MAG: UvrD-helicase domain-containing protein [Phascolarctobacterium sp.]|uniref:UvrD-helicase domain-containing protein n=1 Tax=Phascolarctobacterium sp. TaxID=2049039 RepID=UPI0026DCA46B|nr:UvrD-helicase domain-containing protein [Phascolarctobacterium sp.]MDO4922099.1 UvrD-helicase domain-containing protein [Phascolarctobacterium sp.]